MADVNTLPNATVLFDEYQIVRVLGAGGFGITYLARHLNDEKLVAIKEYFPRTWCKRDQTGLVSPTSSGDQEQFDWGLRRFLEEAQRLAKFDHPNIMHAERYFSVNGTAYMVLSYEEGQTLGHWLQERSSQPDQAELDAIIAPLLAALELLHDAGVFHRDLSPDNILIRSDGSPVLLDFGASREQISRHSQLMTAIIKPGYSPLEQYDNKATRQGPWSDIYAMGAVLYGIIAKEQPPESPARFAHDDYVPLAETVEPGVYRTSFLDAIDWALRLLPDTRPQSIADWRKSLLGKRSIPAATVVMQPSAAPRPDVGTTRQAGRQVNVAPVPSAPSTGARATLIAIGIAGLLALGGITGYVMSSGPDVDAPSQATLLAREVYEALALTRGDRLTAARGLYHLGFSKDAKLDMAFVNSGTVDGPLRVAVMRFQKSRGEDQSGYPTAAQVLVLKGSGAARTAWEEEISITVLKEYASAAWSRIRLVLQESKDLQGGSQTRGDVRAALKRYQARKNIKPSGYFSKALFYAFLSTPIRLQSSDAGSDQRFSDWHFSKTNTDCRIWTNVSRIKGRSLVLDSPRVEISRDIDSAHGDIIFNLVQTRQLNLLLDVSRSVYFKGDDSQYQLQIDDGRVKPRKLRRNAVSKEVIRKFYAYAGGVEIGGVSRFGGAIALAFSTKGFAEAFAKMANTCGAEIMSWVQQDRWAAAYKNTRGKFYFASRAQSERAAKAKAMKTCEQASEKLRCDFIVAFHSPECFALAGPKSSGKPRYDIAETLQEARKQALQQCRLLHGGKTECHVTKTLCSDGRTG